MKREWTLLLSVLLLFAATGSERVSSVYARRFEASHRAMRRELEDVRVRTGNAEMEKTTYLSMSAKAGRLQDTIQWQADSTNVLRWFADTAGELNARLVNSKLVSISGQEQSKIVLDEFRRTCYTLHLQGTFGALVHYVEHVERSPLVMAVEKFNLSANRNNDGTGELKLTVSCLCPVQATAPAAEGKANE